jgi:hypothetical protein
MLELVPGLFFTSISNAYCALRIRKTSNKMLVSLFFQLARSNKDLGALGNSGGLEGLKSFYMAARLFTFLEQTNQTERQ